MARRQLTIRHYMRLIILSTSLVAFVVLGLNWLSENRRIEAAQAHFLKEERRYFLQLMRLKSEPVNMMATDYSFWDEMIRFVTDNGKNRAWAADNIHTGLQRYHSDFAIVLGPKGAIFIDALSTEALEAGKALELKNLSFTTPQFAHFFYLHNGLIFEVYIAPVQPINGTIRQNIPRGYLAIGRQWNDAYRKELSSLSGAPFVLNIPATAEEGAITLPDQVGNPVATLIPQPDLSQFEQMRTSVMTQTMIGSLLFLTLMGVLAIGIRRYIEKPLTRILALIENPTPETLEEIHRFPNEFGQIASRLMSRYIEQQTLLGQLWNTVDQSAIISKTDLHGIITYANDEFCRISGYTLEELLGQPHNIIRHPDNPKEVFADLWSTIQKGQVWGGVIKNRHKNGNPYYVRTTIFPIQNTQGQTVEYMAIRNDITDVIEEIRLLKEQTTDFLTGLPNRQQLNSDIAATGEPKLALINVDRFRDINDSYGHTAGDVVLKAVAKRLERWKNSHVSIYRTYGDEFAALGNSSVSEEGFVDLCRALLAMLLHEQINIGDLEVPLSVRIGAASGDKESSKKLVIRAEVAIEQARRENKNFVYYDRSFDLVNTTQERIEWTKKIIMGIEDDRFTIYAQPIVNVRNPDEKKYECLIRLIDEDKTLSPYYFMDHAKRSKLYEKLTLQVIRKAFEIFSHQLGDFSINLTMEDIGNPLVTNFLLARLRNNGLAKRLIIEIVESEELSNVQQVEEFIQTLHDMGGRIAIDDFGSGYSNFNYLIRLKADFLKIDGSLIKNIDTDTNAELLIRTIVDFAKKTGIKTIAEFVHNEAIKQKCIDLGIDYLQGFYLGEPQAMTLV